MRERAKKSPFYVAYADKKPSHRQPSHAKEKTSQTVLRVCAYTLRSQRNHSLKAVILLVRTDTQKNSREDCLSDGVFCGLVANDVFLL